MSILLRKRKFITASLIVFVFTLVLSMTAIQPEAAYAADSVGIVDFLYLINNHPDTPKANEALKTEDEQAQKEFNAKAASLSDKEKQDLRIQLAQHVEQRRLELIKPIAEKVILAVKAVAAQKGLTVVVTKASVVCGGVDITEEVVKKLSGK